MSLVNNNKEIQLSLALCVCVIHWAKTACCMAINMYGRKEADCHISDSRWRTVRLWVIPIFLHTSSESSTPSLFQYFTRSSAKALKIQWYGCLCTLCVGVSFFYFSDSFSNAGGSDHILGLVVLPPSVGLGRSKQQSWWKWAVTPIFHSEESFVLGTI